MRTQQQRTYAALGRLALARMGNAPMLTDERHAIFERAQENFMHSREGRRRAARLEKRNGKGVRA
ncbi:MAG: hypothetical protein J6T92_03865 [Ottowia sp.]|nr:hypothetical protein [Ottowia sp.]